MRLLTSFILLALLSTPTFAKSKKKGKMKEIFDQLELSDDQLEKIKAHKKSNKSKMKDLRSEIKDTKKKIKDSFVSDSSSKELSSLHLQMSSLKSKMADLRFSKMVFLKETLTKEQRVKFISLRKKKKD